MFSLKAKPCVVCGCGNLRRGIVSQINSRRLVYQARVMDWQANLFHGASLSLSL